MKQTVFKQNGEIEIKDVKDVDYYTESMRIHDRIVFITNRLSQLSQDFIQVQLGAVFEDLETRKQEFRDLHNELRILQGKEKRIYMEANDVKN